MEEQKNSKYQISLPLILCIGLAGGVLIGASLTNKSGSGDVGPEAQKLREVLSLIKNEYVDTANTEALVEEAIEHTFEPLPDLDHRLPHRALSVCFTSCSFASSRFRAVRRQTVKLLRLFVPQ